MSSRQGAPVLLSALRTYLPAAEGQPENVRLEKSIHHGFCRFLCKFCRIFQRENQGIPPETKEKCEYIMDDL